MEGEGQSCASLRKERPSRASSKCKGFEARAHRLQDLFNSRAMKQLEGCQVGLRIMSDAPCEWEMVLEGPEQERQ